MTALQITMLIVSVIYLIFFWKVCADVDRHNNNRIRQALGHPRQELHNWSIYLALAAFTYVVWVIVTLVIRYN